MPGNEQALSINRLHRLRPSDIECIKQRVSSADDAYAVLELFCRYLLKLEKPTAVELDDVMRIALQLNMAGLWEVIRPAFFINEFHLYFDDLVTQTLCEALKVDAQPAIADGVVRTGDKPTLTSKIRSNLGLKENFVEIKPAKALRRRLRQTLSGKNIGEQKGAVRIRLTGTVKWFNGQKGYGFIAPDEGGKAVVVHKSAMHSAGLLDLHEGDKVSFEVNRGTSKAGGAGTKLTADNIKKL